MLSRAPPRVKGKRGNRLKICNVKWLTAPRTLPQLEIIKQKKGKIFMHFALQNWKVSLHHKASNIWFSLDKKYDLWLNILRWKSDKILEEIIYAAVIINK